MEIVNRVARMASISAKLLADGVRLGLVPTMGGLHPGHVGLIQAARRMADLVVVSIFVNRLQFRTEEEYGRYPRDITKDVDLLRRENVDYIFTPTDDEMYPPRFGTFVQVEESGRRLSGLPRDLMFRGATTGTLKLIHVIRPAFVFLGQKDAVQALIIRKMIRDLGLNTECVVVPVIRDNAGIAYGVRNQFLHENQRNAASVIYRSLQAVERMIADGESRSKAILAEISRVISTEALAQFEYGVVLDPETMEPMNKVLERAWVGVGVRIGDVSLTDCLSVERATKV